MAHRNLDRLLVRNLQHHHLLLRDKSFQIDLEVLLEKPKFPLNFSHLNQPALNSTIPELSLNEGGSFRNPKQDGQEVKNFLDGLYKMG